MKNKELVYVDIEEIKDQLGMIDDAIQKEIGNKEFSTDLTYSELLLKLMIYRAWLAIYDFIDKNHE